jgi:hypothetical protein
MVCVKYKKREFVCIKKSILYGLLYAFLMTITLLSMDSLYALSNEYFIFEFTTKEFFNKMFLLTLFISLMQKQRRRAHSI